MAPTELPTIVGGRYRIERLLGRGGMGAVYEVEHLHTGERLALKLLEVRAGKKGPNVERFKLEARVSAQIRSEHVVRVTDADISLEAGGTPYVVMELLDGSDLERLAGTEPQPKEAVVTWLRQAARALDKAHRLQIIHRDLKPANLFLASREDGSPLLKILDFGIAKILDEDGGGTTTTGEVVGTPLYMAPEHARGSETLTGAADRYALGLIAYRLLCGRTYWRKTNITQILHELLYAPMDPPSKRESQLGAPFDEWFGRAVARDPAARFTSAAAQVEALAEALGLPARPVSSDPGVSSPAPPNEDADIQESPTRPPIQQTVAPRLPWTGDVGPTLQLAASTMAAGRPNRTRAPWVAGAFALVAAGAFVGALVATSRPALRAVPAAAMVDATDAAQPLVAPLAASPAPLLEERPVPAPRALEAGSAVRKLSVTKPRASATDAALAPPSTIDPFEDQK